MEKRPTVLFLMSDEHRADVTGYEGNKVVRTPIIDELTENGVVFRNAYTPSPICIPGRQAMMAGQLPRHCGCELFGDDLAPNYMTFSRRFTEYAYATVCCGKLHHMGIDQMQGWMRRIGMDDMIDARYIENKQEEEFAAWVRPQAFNWKDEIGVVKRAAAERGPYMNRDEYTIEGALRFIDEYFVSPVFDRAQTHRPLLLKVSLVQPHYPYSAEPDKFRYYLNRVKPFVNEEVSTHPALSRRHLRPGIDASEREIQKTTAAYYGMVEMMDEHLGQVLRALEEVGQNLDDWIIVYTSDHGEMLGQHGVWEKKSFYEASVRVPLIIRWPERFSHSRTVYENVNLCDLFATLCDLAEIPVPSGLDSRSLVPLMDGHSEAWDNETISQCNGKEIMIKQNDLKYMYYGPEVPEVLFDLSKDPDEKMNKIHEADYAADIARFRERRQALGF